YARDVEPLGIGARVGRSEKDAGVVGKAIEQREIDRGQSLQQIAGLEQKAHPEALLPRPREEGAAGEAFRIARVGEVEVADERDGFDVREWQGKDAPGEVEKIERPGVNKACGRQVAVERIAGESPDEDFFSRTGEDRGHLVDRLSHGECSDDREKRSGQNWQSSPNHAKIATCAALLWRCKELIFQGLRADACPGQRPTGEDPNPYG